MIVQTSSAFGQSSSQLYDIGVMARNGTDGYFFFSYQVPEKTASDQSKMDIINYRLGEELSNIGEEYDIYELIEIIDSIGPRIENKIENQHELKNLEVLKIGVPESIKDYLVKSGVNVDRVKTIESIENKNYFSHLAFEKLTATEKSHSKDLLLTVRTKFDSEVLLEYSIHYNEQVSPKLPVDSLDQEVKNIILDSLHKYTVYDFWAIKRGSIYKIMEDILKEKYPETNRVSVFDIVIPEEAEKYFKKIDQSRLAILEDLSNNFEKCKKLTLKLESDNELSKDEITEIEKEIEMLERERESIREKGRTLTYEYKPK